MTTKINKTCLCVASASLAVAAFLAHCAYAQAPSPNVAAVDDSQWRGGPSVDWFVNWDKALAEAKRTGKPMFLLNTGSDWCGWCKKLKAEVLDKPEFAEFAKEKLVLVYLDSPNRNPLVKSQKAHNRLITRTLPFGGGVPHVLVVDATGKKLGAIGGGGQTVDAYLDRLRGILENDGSEVKTDAMRLFTEGYSVLAAEAAARLAALPPVKKSDFKAKLTGVAVVDNAKRYGSKAGIEFLPPDTHVEVPFGKTALFRVEYDFPEGYGAAVWVLSESCDDGKNYCGYFGSNPSGRYKGKGIAYGFLSLLERGKACNLKRIVIKTNAEPELDDFPRGWQIGTFTVDITFKEKTQDLDKDKKEEGASSPTSPSPTASKSVSKSMSKSVPKGWGEDFAAASEEAKKSGKLMLLAFSGSDWCGWCVKMEKEIYSDKKFIHKAKKQFVLVMIDSPRDKEILSPLVRKQNPELVRKYEIHGYPSTIVARPSGEVVERFSGFQRDGADAFAKRLSAVADRVGAAKGADVNDAPGDENAEKDDRFFFTASERSKIAARELQQRKDNAKNDFELTSFAGIQFGMGKADGAPTLDQPYHLLSIVKRTSYSGGKLSGVTLIAPAKDVRAMSADALRVETCKLVRAIEDDLGIRFAVTGSKIDFVGKKASIVVTSNRSSGILSVQVTKKK